MRQARQTGQTKRAAQADKRINLVALTKPQLVELLTKMGSASFSMGILDSDIAAGAPVNSDGTIHIIHYIAWLITQTTEQ